MAVTQQALDGVEIDPTFKQMRRETMTKRVNAAWLREARATLRRQIRLLQTGRIHRLRRVLASSGKQPVGGALDFPVRAQGLEQTRREQGVSILAALPLHDADHHPRGIDIGHLQWSTSLKRR